MVLKTFILKSVLKGFKGADTPPTPTQNDLLVAMHMVYLVLLIVELFCYVDEQMLDELLF